MTTDDTTRQAAEDAFIEWGRANDVFAHGYSMQPDEMWQEAYLIGVTTERKRLLAELEQLAVHWNELANTAKTVRDALRFGERGEAVSRARVRLEDGWRCTDPTHTRCREMAERSETP